MVLTVSSALSPVTGLFCHRRPLTNVVPKPGRADITSANLTPASGRQDHTTSPYAATSFVSSLLIAHRPFANPPCNHVARLTLPRPPHPIPTFVTIMIRPSSRDGMARTCRDDLPDGESEIFLREGLDRLMGDLPVGQNITIQGGLVAIIFAASPPSSPRKRGTSTHQRPRLLDPRFRGDDGCDGYTEANYL